jgi:hypothetical protein
MRALLLFALLGTPAAAQIPRPVPPSRPPVHWPGHRPSGTVPAVRLPPLPARHASAAQAYAASAAATVGGVALGAGLVYALPSGGAETLGWLVVGGALAAGPAAGNWTLGAEDDLGRALMLKGAGVVAAAVTAPVAVGLCALNATGDGSCGGVVWIPIAVAATGLAAGAAIDLGTIPRNARCAAVERAGRPVTVVPTGAGWAVRVPL